MSIFQRKLLCDMASTLPTSEPEDACGDMQAESALQDVLFSEVATSVCYWATVLLLAIAGTGLLYWRFTHPVPFAVPVGDPFGVTTPPWLIVSLPPIGVAASLGHAAWSRSPRPTDLENVGDGGRSHRSNGRGYPDRNTPGSALKAPSPQPESP